MRQAILIAALWIAACGPKIGSEAKIARRIEAHGITGPLPTTPRWVPAYVPPSALRLASADGASPSRRIVDGIRIEEDGGDSLLSATQRFRTPPRVAFEVPARLGGGFLFATGGSIERSETWLGDTAPLFASASPVDALEVGLDRIYVRFNDASREGIDPRTGERIGLGAFPSAPMVTQFAAADGWRAVAIADLIGPIATFDAGATWLPLELPSPVSEVSAANGVMYAELNDRPQRSKYEIRAPNQMVHVATPPAVQKKDSDISPWLGLAVEAGWPLRDGSAALLHDGALVYIDLANGHVQKRIPDVLPRRDAHCHALLMGAVGGFGFVCSEGGTTSSIYSLDQERGALHREKAWPEPRAIVSSGNGSIVIKGGCAEERAPATPELACVRDQNGTYRELRIAEVARSKIVALADRRVVALDPPTERSSGRIRIFNGDALSTVALDRSLIPHTEERALRLGVWLDGFEERRTGVIGGWINIGAAMVGVEVHLDGSVVFGPPIEVGDAFVASRYGLANGFATIDGGMSWTAIDAPAATTRAGSPLVRAVGPIGAIARDWVRIGWGPSPTPPTTKPLIPPVASPTRHHHGLVCRPDGSVTKPSTKPLDAPPVSIAPIDKEDDLITLQTDSRTQMADASKLGAARILVWRKKNGDSLTPAKWIVQWERPDGNRSISAAAALPRSLADALSRRWGAVSTSSMMHVSVFPGDDDAHALLSIFLYSTSTHLLFELEKGAAPTEIVRPEGVQDISAATRTFDQWYFASTNSTATQIWRSEIPRSTLLATFPRASSEFTRARVGLGSDSESRSIILLVDGVRSSPTTAPSLWGVPIAIDSGRTATPFVIDNTDPMNSMWVPCGVTPGFVADIVWPSTTRMAIGLTESWLTTSGARVKIANGSACLLEVYGRTSQAASAASSLALLPNSIRLPLHLIENGKRAHFDCAIAR